MIRLLAIATLCNGPLMAQQSATATTPASGNTANAVAPARPQKPTEVVTGTGPNGAKMRCRDGSYPSPNAADTACDAKGGILVRFPLERVPARAPALGRVKAPVLDAPKDPSTDAALRAPIRRASDPVVPAPAPPPDATLMCADGTFIVADTVRARCASRGGVSLIFPPKRRP
jgi:hypothetical protein